MSKVEVYIQGEQSVNSFPYKRENVICVKIDGQNLPPKPIEADEDRFIKSLSLTIAQDKETIDHNFSYCGDNESLPTSVNLELRFKSKSKKPILLKFNIRLPFDYPYPHSELFWHPNNLYPNIDISKNKVHQLLNSRQRSIIWIHGATGIGKSTTLDKIYKLLDVSNCHVERISALRIAERIPSNDIVRNFYIEIYNRLQLYLGQAAIIDFPAHEDIKVSFAEVYRRLREEKDIRSIILIIDEFDVLIEWSSTPEELKEKLLNALKTLSSPYNNERGEMLSTCLLVADCLPPSTPQRFGERWNQIFGDIERHEVKVGYLSYSNIETILGSIPMPQELLAHLTERLWVWTLGHPYCVITLLKEYFKFLHPDTLHKWRESNSLHNWPWLDDLIIEKREDLKDLIQRYLTVDASHKVSNNRPIPRTTSDQQMILTALAANKPLPEHIRENDQEGILRELESRGLIFRSMISADKDLVNQWTIPIPLIRYLWQ